MKESNYSTNSFGNAVGKSSVSTVVYSHPSLEDITIFMARNTAKLGSYPLCEVAPFEYTGSDYCMLLAVCVPDSVPLSVVHWGPNPLSSQARTNLDIFCQQARQIDLPGVPRSSLCPDLLCCSPSCLLHHLKVQHWLFVLAQQSPPSPEYNPFFARQYYSNIQTGEPFLKVEMCENAVNVFDYETCPDMKVIPPITSQKLELWTPYFKALEPPELKPTPFSACAPTVLLSDGKESREKKENLGSACNLLISNSKSAASSATSSMTSSTPGRSKPWQSYSKPWNLPTIAALQARKAKEEASIKKRVEKARQDGVSACVENAFAKSSVSLAQQHSQCSQRRRKLYQSLVKIRERVMKDVFRGSVINYAEVLSMLEEAKD